MMKKQLVFVILVFLASIMVPLQTGISNSIPDSLDNNQILSSNFIKTPQHFEQKSDMINLKARYIYDTDIDTANFVSDILVHEEFKVELIHISSIQKYSWADTGLVVIGPDTGSAGKWSGTLDDVGLLTKDYKQFLSLGEGGLSFQQQIPDLYVNWMNSTSESAISVQPDLLRDNLWIYPYLLPKIQTFYTSASTVYTIPDKFITPSIVVHGRIDSGNALMTYENKQFYYLGIQDVSIWDKGTLLLMENIISFLRDEGVPVSSTLTGSADLTYEVGSTGNNIQWTFQYLLFQNYTIYMDTKGVEKSTTIIGNTISYSVDGLAVGEYNFSILLFDALDLSYHDWILVTITPYDSVPDITSTPDFEYWYGVNKENITWYAYDNNPSTYQIYRNGTLVDSGNWVDSDPIIYLLDDIKPGSYNFTLQVNDLSGKFTADTVFVTVLLDSENPALTLIGNFTMDEISLNKTIHWSASDRFPSSYKILNDSNIITQGFWDTDELYTLDFNNYTLGNYNITFVVSDLLGNVDIESYTLEIVDLISPLIIGESQMYTITGKSDTIHWVLSDTHPDNFTVYLDGNRYINGSWAEIPIVDINLAALSVGTYNFTIIAEDTSGNIATHMVRVYIDLSYTTETTAQGGGSSDNPLIDIKVEYLIGVGFVAVIGAGVNLLRRRSG